MGGKKGDEGEIKVLPNKEDTDDMDNKHHADDDLRDQRRNASPLHSRAAEPCRREPADGMRRMSDGKK